MSCDVNAIVVVSLSDHPNHPLSSYHPQGGLIGICLLRKPYTVHAIRFLPVYFLLRHFLVVFWFVSPRVRFCSSLLVVLGFCVSCGCTFCCQFVDRLCVFLLSVLTGDFVCCLSSVRAFLHPSLPAAFCCCFSFAGAFSLRHS